jgi:hypothetical protein
MRLFTRGDVFLTAIDDMMNDEGPGNPVIFGEIIWTTGQRQCLPFRRCGSHVLPGLPVDCLSKVQTKTSHTATLDLDRIFDIRGRQRALANPAKAKEHRKIRASGFSFSRDWIILGFTFHHGTQ